MFLCNARIDRTTMLHWYSDLSAGWAALQLRHSIGISPNFPNFQLQQLTTDGGASSSDHNYSSELSFEILFKSQFSLWEMLT